MYAFTCTHAHACAHNAALVLSPPSGGRKEQWRLGRTAVVLHAINVIRFCSVRFYLKIFDVLCSDQCIIKEISRAIRKTINNFWLEWNFGSAYSSSPEDILIIQDITFLIPELLMLMLCSSGGDGFCIPVLEYYLVLWCLFTFAKKVYYGSLYIKGLPTFGQKIQASCKGRGIEMVTSAVSPPALLIQCFLWRRLIVPVSLEWGCLYLSEQTLLHATGYTEREAIMWAKEMSVPFPEYIFQVQIALA